MLIAAGGSDHIRTFTFHAGHKHAEKYGYDGGKAAGRQLDHANYATIYEWYNKVLI